MNAATPKYAMAKSGRELHVIATWRDEPYRTSDGGYNGYIKTACKRTYYAQWTYQNAASQFRVCPKCAAA